LSIKTQYIYKYITGTPEMYVSVCDNLLNWRDHNVRIKNTIRKHS